MSLIDHGILLLYLAGIYGIGAWCSRRQTSASEFAAAGGSLPGWAIGLSIFGTFFSSISFLGLPSAAFKGNWNVYVFSLTIPLAALVAIRWFVPFYRRSGAVSAYEHFEARFGAWARTYAVACYLLTQLARCGTILYLLAVALKPLTGWNEFELILVSGGIVIGYTMLGGLEAVVWTDVVQSLIFIVAAVACVLVLWLGVPGGPASAFEVAGEAGKFGLGPWDADFTRATFWSVFLYGIVMNLQNFGVDQSYVQRYLAARDVPSARRSVWLGAGLYPVISAMFLFIGTGLFVYFQTLPDRLPREVAVNPDLVFPYFIQHELPLGLPGLIMAAIFAAAQSTVSTSINSSATLLYADVYCRYWQRTPDDRHAVRFLRWASLGFGIAGTGAALAMIGIKQALNTWWMLSGIFAGGVLGMFLLAWWVPRATGRHALIAVTLSLLVIAWMTLSPQLPPDQLTWLPRNPLYKDLPIVVGTTIILVVGTLLSRLSPRRTS